jgi:hypothetical protein
MNRKGGGVMTRRERNYRRSLRDDIAGSGYWSDLAPTVELVPFYLVEAWVDLCDGWDDDAMDTWTQLLHAFSPPRSLRYIETATDLVREYISQCTCGHTRAAVAAAGAA